MVFRMSTGLKKRLSVFLALMLLFNVVAPTAPFVWADDDVVTVDNVDAVISDADTGDEGTGDEGTGDEGTGDQGPRDEGTASEGTGDESISNKDSGDQNPDGTEDTDVDGGGDVEDNAVNVADENDETENAVTEEETEELDPEKSPVVEEEEEAIVVISISSEEGTCEGINIAFDQGGVIVAEADMTNGTVEMSLPEGEYQVIMTGCPDTLYPGEEWTFVNGTYIRNLNVVNGNNTLTVSLVRAAMDLAIAVRGEAENLAGIVFSVVVGGQTVSDTTGSQGQAVLKSLPVDTYSITMTGSPDGYKPEGWTAEGSAYTYEYKVTRDNGSLSVELVQDLVTLDIITKTNLEEVSVKDVKFELVDINSIGITDDDGQAVFKDLMKGSYTLKMSEYPEGVMPAGWILSEDGDYEIDLVVDTDKVLEVMLVSETELISVSFTFLNPVRTGIMALAAAIFGGSASKAEDVIITVYDTDNNPVLDGSSNQIQGTVDASGTVTINGLAVGTTYRFFASNLADGIRPQGWKPITLGGVGGYYYEYTAGSSEQITVQLETFRVYTLSFTAHTGTIQSNILPDVKITLETLINGVVVSSDEQFTGANGNYYWMNLQAVPGVTYRVTVLSPDPDMYLTKTAITGVNRFTDPDAGMVFQEIVGSDGKTYRQYTWVFDLNEVPDENVFNTLAFYNNKGEVKVTKTNGEGVVYDQDNVPWIGVSAVGSTDIIWIQVPVNGIVNIGDLLRRTVTFNQGVPVTETPAYYYLYEYAPVDSAPDGFSLQLDKNRYKLPPVSVDFELWRNDTSFSLDDVITSKDVNNSKYEYQFNMGGLEADLAGSYSARAVEGQYWHWNGQKSTADSPKELTARGNAFDINYMVVFTRTYSADRQTVLTIDNATLTVAYDYRAAKGYNQITGTVYLEKKIGNEWVSVNHEDINGYLSDGSLISGTDMQLGLPYNLRDDSFTPNAEYRVRFEGEFRYTYSGQFDLNDPDTYQKAPVEVSAVLAKVGNVNIEQGGSSENYRLSMIEDTFSIPTGAANITSITDVYVNGTLLSADQYRFDPATKRLTITRASNPDTDNKVIVTYTAHFTDVSWDGNKATPCTDSYYIMNQAKGYGSTSGTFATNEVQVKVNIPKYSILKLHKDNQKVQLKANGELDFAPGVGVVFDLYDANGTTKIMFGTTDASGNLIFSTSGTIAATLAIPTGINTKEIYEDIRLLPGTEYRIYEVNPPADQIPEGWIWDAVKGQYYTTFTTGECGPETVNVQNKFQGQLTVTKEIQASSGTVIDSANWPVGDFVITVTGPIGEATQQTYTVTLNKDKTSETLTNLKPGTYTIVETSGGVNYEVIIGSNGNVTVTNAVQNIKVVNKQKSANLTIGKTSNTLTSIANNEVFIITITGKFSDTTDTSKTVSFRKSEVNGTAKEVSGIICGETYTVVETSITNGDKTTYTVTGENTRAEAITVDRDVVINNDKKGGASLTVRKITDTLSSIASNEEFVITITGRFSDTNDTNKTVTFTKSEVNGAAKAVGGIIYGETYTVVETSITNGDKNTYTITGEITTAEAITEIKAVEIKNNKKGGASLTVKKTSDTLSSIASNEEFVVTVTGRFSDTSDASKTVSFTKVDVQNGTVKPVSGIIYGEKYTVAETSVTNGDINTYNVTGGIETAEAITSVKAIAINNDKKGGASLTVQKTSSYTGLIGPSEVFVVTVTGRFSDTTDTSKMVTFTKNEVNGAAKAVSGIIYGEKYTVEETSVTNGNIANYTVVGGITDKVIAGAESAVIDNARKTGASMTVQKTTSTLASIADNEEFVITITGRFSDTTNTSKTVRFTKSEVNGAAKEIGGIIYGETYTVVETSVTNGDISTYNVTGGIETAEAITSAKAVVINNDKKGGANLTVQKTSSYTGLIGPSEVFVVTVTGRFSDTTDTSKTVTFTKNEVNGAAKAVSGIIYGEKYTVEETSVTNGNIANYTVVGGITDKIIAGAEAVVIDNARKTGASMTVQKTTSTLESIADNEEFVITITGRFSDTTNTSKTVSFTKSEVNGAAKEVRGIIYGEVYTVVETSVTNGDITYYTVAGEITDEVITNAKEVIINNTRKSNGQIEVTKNLLASDGSNKPSAENTFLIGLYLEDVLVQLENITTFDGVATVTFTDLIYGKEYVVKEVEPDGNGGYKVVDADFPYIVVVDSGGASYATSQPIPITKADPEAVTITNTEKPLGELTITKKYVDAQGRELAGKTFQVAVTGPGTEAEGVYYRKVFKVTSGTSTILQNLIYGEYTIEEIEGDGYLLENYTVKEFSNTVVLSIKNKEQSIEITNIEKPGDLTVTKLQDGELRDGITFKLVGDNGYSQELTTPYFSIFGQSRGIVNFMDLPHDTYTLYEYSPKGYEPTSGWEKTDANDRTGLLGATYYEYQYLTPIVIRSDDTMSLTHAVEVDNEQIKGQIIVAKNWEGEDTPGGEREYPLFKLTGNGMDQDLERNGNIYTSTDDLPFGVYTLTEYTESGYGPQLASGWAFTGTETINGTFYYKYQALVTLGPNNYDNENHELYQTVTVNNKTVPGTVIIGKSVRGSYSYNEDYTFGLRDSNGDPVNDANGQVIADKTISNNRINQIINMVNGLGYGNLLTQDMFEDAFGNDLSFLTKSVVFTNVPHGDYRIYEITYMNYQPDGTEWTLDNSILTQEQIDAGLMTYYKTITIGSDLTGFSLNKGGPTILSVNTADNVYTEGYLNIFKAVEGYVGADQFAVEVTGIFMDSNGTAVTREFDLTNDGSIDIPNVIAGESYIIHEIGESSGVNGNYNVSYSGLDVSGAILAGLLDTEEEPAPQATITNTRKEAGTLEVTKTITSGTYVAGHEIFVIRVTGEFSDTEQDYKDFHFANAANTASNIYAIGASIEVTGVVYGNTYTVTEIAGNRNTDLANYTVNIDGTPIGGQVSELEYTVDGEPKTIPVNNAHKTGNELIIRKVVQTGNGAEAVGSYYFSIRDAGNNPVGVNLYNGFYYYNELSSNTEITITTDNFTGSTIVRGLPSGQNYTVVEDTGKLGARYAWVNTENGNFQFEEGSADTEAETNHEVTITNRRSPSGGGSGGSGGGGGTSQGVIVRPTDREAPMEDVNIPEEEPPLAAILPERDDVIELNADEESPLGSVALPKTGTAADSAPTLWSLLLAALGLFIIRDKKKENQQ